MHVQKMLYECLLHLGVDMIHPQNYVCSESERSPDLVFSFLKWDKGGMYVLLATYLLEDGKALPEPEVVLWVSRSKKTATVFTCEWTNEKEDVSPALDTRVWVWLNVQIARGHHFLGLRKMPGNVVALHAARRKQHLSSL